MIKSSKFTAVLSFALLCALALMFAACGGPTTNVNSGNSATATTATPSASRSPSSSPSPTPTPLACDTQINENLYNAIRAVPVLKAQMKYFTAWSTNCKVTLYGYVETDALYVQVINVVSGVKDNSNKRIQGLDVLDFVSHREAYRKLHPELECASDEQQCGDICIKPPVQCWPGSGSLGADAAATPTPTATPVPKK